MFLSFFQHTDGVMMRWALSFTASGHLLSFPSLSYTLYFFCFILSFDQLDLWTLVDLAQFSPLTVLVSTLLGSFFYTVRNKTNAHKLRLSSQLAPWLLTVTNTPFGSSTVNRKHRNQLGGCRSVNLNPTAWGRKDQLHRLTHNWNGQLATTITDEQLWFLLFLRSPFSRLHYM